jgi:DNA-binding transcriptional ArsR family regulator
LKVNECICGDIVNELPLAQPTVSQHLKELKNAGLIKGNIDGNSICYCIDEKGIEVLNVFSKVISSVKKQNCLKFFGIKDRNIAILQFKIIKYDTRTDQRNTSNIG